MTSGKDGEGGMVAMRGTLAEIVRRVGRDGCPEGVLRVSDDSTAVRAELHLRCDGDDTDAS